jgi:predicted phage terminase large subunit-like protein
MGQNVSPRVFEAVLRADLYSFVQAIFPIVSPGGRFLPNWSLEAITYALTRVMKGEITRLIINVPPRSLKSICASVALPAYVLGHDPTQEIVCVSYSEALARKHANDCRAVMTSPLYRRLFSRTRISPLKDTELEFMTTARGCRLATSVGGTLTGRGGNLIIIDDPMKPQDAQSQSARENLEQWYGNTLLSRLNDKTRGAIIVVMQRLHVNDLVGHLLEQEGWSLLKLPAIAEVPEQIPLGPNRFHYREPGSLLHPEREPQAALDAQKREMGSAEFAGQYQQSPVPPGGNMINWELFQVHNDDPPIGINDKLIASWDTAMTANELSDYSCCIIAAVKAGKVFILDLFRERLNYPTLKRKVIDLHNRWQSRGRNYSLLIENKGSGTSLIQDLRATHEIRAIPMIPDGDKVMRMSRYSSKIEAGYVSLPFIAPWLDDFHAEILAFPLGRHDDQVDALSQLLDRVYNPRHMGARWGSY